MRILLSGLQAGNRSGTGNYTFELARWLPKVAHDMEIHILWPEHAPIPQDFDDSQVVRWAAGGLVGRFLANQTGIQRLARHIGAQLIHYPATVGSFFSGTIPSVVTIHDLSFFQDRRWFRLERALYYRFGTSLCACHTARFIADSESTANDMVRFLKIGRDCIDVIYLAPQEAMGLDTPLLAKESLRKRYHLPSEFFLYLGTLEPRKNLVRLIQAYDAIAGQCPFDLVIAGRNGWKEKGIYSAAHAAVHSSRIHFPGFIETSDIPALYATAKAFVYPSLFEGFGLPVADAMAAGLPVITSNCTALPEVVGNAALLVVPEEVDSIATALKRISDNPLLREDLSVRGRIHAEKFSWRRTAEKTAQSYRCAIAHTKKD